MSKLLRTILGTKEPAYSLRIKALESVTGHSKIDLSVLSDISAGTRKAVMALGLDPDDTTAEELWSSLYIRASQDDEELKKSSHGSVEKMLEKLNKRLPATEAPTITHAALKKILKAKPPKKVMSALGFRSTDSMLKRAPLEQLLLGAFMLESITWHRSFAKQLKNLNPSDVTMARPRAVIIDKRLLKKSRYHHVVSLQCAGLVGVPKLPDSVKGGYLLTAALASEGLFHVHVRGVLLKLHRFSENLLKRIAHYTYTSPDPVGEIGKISIPWMSCYVFISQQRSITENAPEATVEPADFFWRSPAEAIPSISQRVDFWQNTDALALVNGQDVVSLSISDVAHNLASHAIQTHGVRTSLARNVSAELLARYIAAASMKDKIMKKVGF